MPHGMEVRATIDRARLDVLIPEIRQRVKQRDAINVAQASDSASAISQTGTEARLALRKATVPMCPGRAKLCQSRAS